MMMCGHSHVQCRVNDSCPSRTPSFKHQSGIETSRREHITSHECPGINHAPDSRHSIPTSFFGRVTHPHPLDNDRSNTSAHNVLTVPSRYSPLPRSHVRGFENQGKVDSPRLSVESFGGFGVDSWLGVGGLGIGSREFWWIRRGFMVKKYGLPPQHCPHTGQLR